MKKFRFRLEPLLKLKAHREKEKQKIHALALHKVIEQEHGLESISHDRLGHQVQLREYLQGALDIGRLSAFSRYFVKLKKDELTGREMLRAFRKEAEKKRGELIEATRQRKIYEKLKERRHEQYIKNYLLTEQKEQDEIASNTQQHKKNSR